jgi:hypothetical protein
MSDYPSQKFALGQNVTAPTEGTDLESPHAGVLSAFLGGDSERDIWYRVRDIHGCEFDFPESDLSAA